MERRGSLNHLLGIKALPLWDFLSWKGEKKATFRPAGRSTFLMQKKTA